MKRTRSLWGWLVSSALLCVIAPIPVSAENIVWSSDTHQPFEADFNHDGYADLLLQAKTRSDKHYFIPGQPGKKQRFDYSQRFELPLTIVSMPWSAEHTQILPIKLLGKVGASLLVLPKSAEKALLLDKIESAVDLNKTSQLFEYKQNTWLRNIETPVYFAGDFDGDGQQDVLQIDPENGDHQVILFDKNQKFRTSKKLTKTVRWGLKNNEHLIIKDFNKDGQDDIFALIS